MPSLLSVHEAGPVLFHLPFFQNVLLTRFPKSTHAIWFVSILGYLVGKMTIFDVSSHFFMPSLLSVHEAGRFYFIRLFSECASHTVSKEYPLHMVCINFGASCPKDDDFRRFWSISVGLAIFRAVRPADFIFVLIFQICPLGAFLKSRVCVLFNLIVFYLTIFATKKEIKMTECIVNTQVFLVAQCFLFVCLIFCLFVCQSVKVHKSNILISKGVTRN